MPGYISHSIMMDEIIKNNGTDNHIFKIDPSINELRTFSLGADLASYSRIMMASHNENTQLFFLNMIYYIKYNNLQDNNEVMACLYGHIAHYFMDLTIHPYVYYLEINSKSTLPVPSHTLIEGFYDEYLTKTKGYKEIYPSFFNSGNLELWEIESIINDTYRTTYGAKNILLSYKSVLKTFTLLEKSTKGVFSKETLKKIAGFDKYLKANEYTIEDLLNTHQEEWRNPISGQKHYETFNELYIRSIELTLQAIEQVNKCLYGDKSVIDLIGIFQDISYDTGVKCIKGRKFKYTKKGLHK